MNFTKEYLLLKGLQKIIHRTLTKNCLELQGLFIKFEKHKTHIQIFALLANHKLNVPNNFKVKSLQVLYFHLFNHKMHNLFLTKFNKSEYLG